LAQIESHGAASGPQSRSDDPNRYAAHLTGGAVLEYGFVEWLDDSLPGLAAVRARKEEFDLVMLTAVWMHLDEARREVAMPNVSA
jgi:hypothetical protein